MKSSLVVMEKLSPNHSGQRTQPISRLTVHHAAGDKLNQFTKYLCADKQKA